MKKPYRKGFTLIELLVVIAIISILAAVLLPVLASVELRGQQVVCVNNLRQLAYAHTLYILDYNKDFAYQDSTPYYSGWGSLLIPFATNAASIQLCPSAPPPTPTPPASTNGGINYGRSDLAACIYDTENGPPFQTSYAYNGWFYTGNPPPEITVVVDNIPVDDVTNHFLSDNAVRYPSQTPVFADAMLPETWPVPSDLPATDLRHGQTESSDALEYMMMRVTIARHGGRPASAAPTKVDINQPLPGAINLALFDGHVEQSRLQNLWNYYWCYGWHTPSPNPP
jgi:prepilin-type N-terminal cleavage/methylation domain-containing protein/prepilin-type processing-associated H-X9-DG protein